MSQAVFNVSRERFNREAKSPENIGVVPDKGQVVNLLGGAFIIQDIGDAFVRMTAAPDNPLGRQYAEPVSIRDRLSAVAHAFAR